jgi:glycogen(starch) synthase
MNVLLISFEFPPATAVGGIGFYMFHQARMLEKHHIKVTVFSALPDGQSVVYTNISSVNHYGIPAANNEEFRLNAARFFENYIKEHSVDIIESPEVGACALEIKKNFPHIPLVVKMHTPSVLITKVSNTYQSMFGKLRFVAGALLRGKIDMGYWAKQDKNYMLDVEYQICKSADALLSPSMALKKWTINFWRIEADKIRIIPNTFSADSDLFELPIERQNKTICFIGKLTVLKGMFALTNTIIKILAKHPDYKFILVGRDEWVSEKIPSMQQWMSKRFKDVQGRVFFKGAISHEEVKKVLAISEICIVPSLWENYPTVILEAMAAGCTVAAADAGGIPEMILNNNNGLLFPPKSAAYMTKVINRLIENPTLRFQFATKARQVLRKKNDGHFEKDLIAIYSGLSAIVQKQNV